VERFVHRLVGRVDLRDLQPFVEPVGELLGVDDHRVVVGEVRDADDIVVERRHVVVALEDGDTEPVFAAGEIEVVLLDLRLRHHDDLLVRVTEPLGDGLDRRVEHRRVDRLRSAAAVRVVVRRHRVLLAGGRVLEADPVGLGVAALGDRNEAVERVVE